MHCNPYEAVVLCKHDCSHQFDFAGSANVEEIFRELNAVDIL